MDSPSRRASEGRLPLFLAWFVSSSVGGSWVSRTSWGLTDSVALFSTAELTLSSSRSARSRSAQTERSMTAPDGADGWVTCSAVLYISSPAATFYEWAEHTYLHSKKRKMQVGSQKPHLFLQTWRIYSWSHRCWKHQDYTGVLWHRNLPDNVSLFSRTKIHNMAKTSTELFRLIGWNTLEWVRQFWQLCVQMTIYATWFNLWNLFWNLMWPNLHVLWSTKCTDLSQLIWCGLQSHPTGDKDIYLHLVVS